MNKITTFLAAGAITVGSLAGAGIVTAMAVPDSGLIGVGSDVNLDLHQEGVHEPATVNHDVDTAAEQDVNDGDVDDVDLQENASGETATSGDINTSSGTNGPSGNQSGPDTQGSSSADQ